MAPTLLLQTPASSLCHHMSLEMLVLMTLLTTALFSNMVLPQHVVEYLPGFPGKLPFRLETGYIGVGEKEEVQLFYYFIQSESNPEDDPLMLWLTGGPGCSSLSGLLYEIGIEAGTKPMMNMKGYILGNPRTDTFIDINGRIPYAHRMGLLSDELYQSAKVHCHGNYIDVDPENVICLNDLERINECLEKICVTHISEPSCGNRRIWRQKSDVLSWHLPHFEQNPIDFLQPFVPTKRFWCRDVTLSVCHTWANLKSVQKALHIREETITEWVRCNHSIYNNDIGPNENITYIRNVQSTILYHQDFTNKSCRALIYSGDHDMAMPHTSTKKWIDSLKLSIQSNWRPWFVEGQVAEDQVAGYTITYAYSDYELTFATVKSAGHTAPEHKPTECFAMISRWFDEIPL